jgi:hypothetical protein
MRLILAVGILWISATGQADESWYGAFDFGVGISPHNLAGGAVGYHYSPEVDFEVGLGVLGARATHAGPGLSTSMRFGSKKSIIVGNVMYSGSGTRTISFEKSCDSISDDSSTRCDERTHEPMIPADRQAEWLYNYLFVGFALQAADAGLNFEIGWTRCFTGRLAVSKAPGDENFGDPVGIEIDSSYFLSPAVVRPGDEGAYFRVIKMVNW